MATSERRALQFDLDRTRELDGAPGTSQLGRRPSAAARPGDEGDDDPTARPAPAPTGSTPRVSPGATIGHYEIVRRLGQGGMGDVYLARDTRLGRLVALKFLLRVNALAAARFVVEARTTAQLAHENIVALHDIGAHQGMPYMVLEYVKGRTLATWLKESDEGGPTGGRRTVSPARAAELMIPVVRALVCAHEAGIVHRDLKPANIMMAESGAIKVLDFGIAKIVDDVAEETLSLFDDDGVPWHDATPGFGLAPLTQTGARLGTQLYMSPEQWGRGTVDERADVWAVGVMLYLLVTGVHPFGLVSLASLEALMLDERPVPSVRGWIPAIGKLGGVIDHCLLKDKTERLGSARALLRELESITQTPSAAVTGAVADVNPYVGLSAFQERDAARFFGREGVVEQVVARLWGQPLLAIIGPSGAGKSSLVRAGVIPALKRGGDAWASFIVRPGTRPLAALADLLGEPELGEDRSALSERLQREPGYLGVALRARAARRFEHILLFVDQFEELYTLAAAGEREAFVACLVGAADEASAPLRVIVSIRHDFLDRLSAAHAALAELVSRGAVLLGPMDRRGLRGALVRPAESVDHRFESEALIDEMLDAIEHTRGALPLLQFSASKLWEERDRQRRVLTEASYRSFGGIAGALVSHADSVLDAMSSGERLWARALLLRLVTPERTRSIATRRDLAEIGGSAAAELTRVLGRLIDARLVTVEGSGPEESTVELVHESLIESWPLLDRWLDEAQEDIQFRSRLGHAAREWEASGLAEGLLWRGEAAQEAQRWYRRHGQGEQGALHLGSREARYLAAVVALAERSRRRRRQVVAAVIAGLSAVALGFSTLWHRADRAADQAAQQAERADQEAALARAQEVEAQRGAARARNAGRMAAARERLGDPTTVLALAREIEPGPVPRGWAALARWALAAGVARAVLAHDDQVWSAAWSPDGYRIASASTDGTVRVWSAGGVGEPLVLRGHGGQVYSTAWSPDGRRIASASADGTVRVWSADGAGEPLVLRGHEGQVYGAAWSPDGRRIATASVDTTVRVWRADGAGEPKVLRGHGARVLAVAWSPEGGRLVSGSWDETVRVWSVDGSGEPVVLRGHGDRIWSVAFGPDGRRVASASWDKTVRVWNADGSGHPIVLRGHESWVFAAAWSPDGRRIASASEDKTVRVWSADGTGEPLVLRGHDAKVTSAAWSPDGGSIVSASWDKSARLWTVDDPKRALVLRGHEDFIFSVAFSPEGRRIASGSYDRSVRVRNADGTGQPLVLRGHGDMVISTAWSPDGRHLASTSADGTIRVWSTDGAGQPLILRGHGGAIYAVAYRPDGRRIASGAEDKTIRIWNTEGTGEPLVLRGHEGQVRSVAYRPDGLRLVSASEDRTVRVWNTEGTGAPLVLRGHDDVVSSAAFTPDGRRIVSTSWDRTVRVWNADGTGEPLVLRGHEGMINSFRGTPFSPDGARFVTSSDDGTVRMWRIDGAGEPLVLLGSSVPFMAASFSPDGSWIAAGGDDKAVWVWRDLEPLRGPDDAQLWGATTYCASIEVRRHLLNMTDETARADRERCQQRVRGAGTARSALR